MKTLLKNYSSKPVTSLISGRVIPDSAQIVAAERRNVWPVYNMGPSRPSRMAILYAVLANVLWPTFCLVFVIPTPPRVAESFLKYLPVCWSSEKHAAYSMIALISNLPVINASIFSGTPVTLVLWKRMLIVVSLVVVLTLWVTSSHMIVVTSAPRAAKDRAIAA